jgi:hypothetical protein
MKKRALASTATFDVRVLNFGKSDYETLLEMNTCGETVAVEHAAYASAAQRLVTSSVSASRSSLLLALAWDGRVGHIPCPLVCRDGETFIDPEVAAAEHEKAVHAHKVQAGLSERIHIGRRSGPLPRLGILWRPREPDSSIASLFRPAIMVRMSPSSSIARE